MPRYRRRATTLTDILNRPFELNRASPQAAGIVAWWPMLASRGMNKLRDMSGRGLDGAFKGAGEPLWRVDGTLGAVLDFDGTDDFISVVDNPALSPSGSFMFSCWLWSQTSGITKVNQVLVCKGVTDGDRSYVAQISSVNKMLLYLTVDGTQANRCYREATTLVTQNIWQFWQFWFTVGSAPRLHIALNGIELATALTGTEVSSVYNSTGALTLGDKGHTSNYFDGYMAGMSFHVPAPPASVRWQMYDPATMWDLYMPLRRWWAVKR